MADCDWTRLAYLLFALTILLAIPQLGSSSTDTLASKPPHTATSGGNPPAFQREPSEPPQTTLHEDAARMKMIGERNPRNRSLRMAHTHPANKRSRPTTNSTRLDPARGAIQSRLETA